MAKRTKPTDPKLAVAYLRVSTDAERQALGVEAQRAAIEQWAAREGVTVACWFTEEVSGSASLDQRPVLLEAIASVRAHGAARLVVHRVDRFSRDPASAAFAELELRRHGASIEVVEGGGGGGDPTGELVRGILLAVARFERAMTVARIRAALRVKKGRGELTGSAPFGFKLGADGKTLEPCSAEQDVVDRIVVLRGGGLSERAIVRALAADGVAGRSGKPLSQAQVHRVLAREAALDAQAAA